ncbi:MAG: divalent metal cation transporter [Candidatus Moduliflexus flocculans]|nr:divalent metal cation transporter [Candidatus Moduliflexus flocculans]
MALFFLIVVVKTGVDFGALLKGLFGFHIPRDREGLTIVLGALGAAVGVNMTFLYPYTLLARGWGREHRGLKNFDLAVSMFAPFVLTTGLVVVACANTLHVQGIRVREAVDAAHALAPVAGVAAGPGRLLAGRPGHVLHDAGHRDGHLRLRPERDAGLRAARLALPGGDHGRQHRHPRRLHPDARSGCRSWPRRSPWS